MTYQNFFSLLPLLMSLATPLLGGCGKQYSAAQGSSLDSSSRLPTVPSSGDGSQEVALCNQLEDSFLTARLMIYYDPNNTYRPDYVHLYLPKIQIDFKKSNYRLILRKWKMSTSGNSNQDDTPLKLRLERLSDHISIGNDMDSIQWSTIANKLKSNLSTDYSFSDAFSEFGFLVNLRDPSGAYDVLKISLYKDGDWVQDWNILLPPFYANPTTYAENQNGTLAQLHPLYGQETSSYDSSSFANLFNGFCF